MQLVLSFDYELFFGEKTGTVQKCLIEPTNALLDMAEQHAIPMTFFVDVGFLIRLNDYRSTYPVLEIEWQQIQKQIQRMEAAGCEVQLHIHPHWEKSTFNGEQWVVNVDGAYKLSDFSPVEAVDIVRRYHAFLQELVQNQVNTFRAGGWCIQPFDLLEQVFEELGIRIDSSVFPGGSFRSPHYAFDFTAIKPFSAPYRFQRDVCVEDTQGYFTEIPISSWEYTPLFYWKLYGFGRLNRAAHRMIGDGTFVVQPGRKKSVLLKRVWNHVSCDGYYASMLQKQLHFYQRFPKSIFVVIGHPKGMTRYSIKTLERFIERNKNSHSFVKYNTCIL